MSEFSEYLDEFMNEKNMNSAELARVMDVERTVIYRYRKGSRVPTEEKTVCRMAAALRMSVPEKEKLLLKYDKLVLGDVTVNSYLYVKKLLKELCDTNINFIPKIMKQTAETEWKKENSILPLESNVKISSCISELFMETLEKESSLYLVMQPRYDEIQKMIRSFFRGSKVNLEQIICLEQNISRSHENLQIFQQILPAFFEQNHYRVLYYYDNLTQHVNTMSWMPNIILTDDCVIQFDYEMEHGVMIHNELYANVMLKEYKKIRDKSISFLSDGKKQMETLDIYEEISLGVRGTIFQQPCLGVGISKDIYEEYLYPFPEKEQFIKNMVEQSGDWEDMTFYPSAIWEQGAVKTFCSGNGMREFMETGRVNEFPEGFYQELPMKARKKVLQRMMQMVREGYVEYFVLPDDVQLPKHIYFYLDSASKTLTLNQVYPEGVERVVVKELGIYQTFQCFIEYLEKKNMFPSKEKVLEELEKIRKEYWQN